MNALATANHAKKDNAQIVLVKTVLVQIVIVNLLSFRACFKHLLP